VNIFTVRTIVEGIQNEPNFYRLIALNINSTLYLPLISIKYKCYALGYGDTND